MHKHYALELSAAAKRDIRRLPLSVENCISSLIEEKIQEMSSRKNDPIVRLRGKLKGKIGGTALFMKDKQADINKEERI